MKKSKISLNAAAACGVVAVVSLFVLVSVEVDKSPIWAEVVLVPFWGSIAGIVVSLLAWSIYHEQEKEERFLTLCKVHPKAIKDAESEQKVVEAFTTLRMAVAEAAKQLEAIDAADVLPQEAQRAYLDTRRKQLRDMLTLVQEFGWI